MTKHKEIMDEIKTSLWELGHTSDDAGHIIKMIDSALLQQLEELERWVESKRTYQHPKWGDEGWNDFNGDWETFHESIGYHKALNDALSHIREQKEEIKKV